MSAFAAPEAGQGAPDATTPGKPDAIAAPPPSTAAPIVAKTRHPWRWVISAIALILLVRFVRNLAPIPAGTRPFAQYITG
ncbi:hypothetical protein AB4305_26725 [Nocardia sp. 2YAB30]|uniref:hypothetical protein n=1 Tax=unclassified Nocardia TaxID=2637762 RepID=UPI003F9D2424